MTIEITNSISVKRNYKSTLNHTPEALKLATKMGLPEGWTAESSCKSKYLFRNPAGTLRFNRKKAVYKHCELKMLPPIIVTKHKKKYNSIDDAKSSTFNPTPKALKLATKMRLPKGWIVETYSTYKYKYNFFNPDGSLRFDSKKAAYNNCGITMPPLIEVTQQRRKYNRT